MLLVEPRGFLIINNTRTRRAVMPSFRRYGCGMSCRSVFCTTLVFIRASLPVSGTTATMLGTRRSWNTGEVPCVSINPARGPTWRSIPTHMALHQAGIKDRTNDYSDTLTRTQDFFDYRRGQGQSQIGHTQSRQLVSFASLSSLPPQPRRQGQDQLSGQPSDLPPKQHLSGIRFHSSGSGESSSGSSGGGDRNNSSLPLPRGGRAQSRSKICAASGRALKAVRPAIAT